MRIVFGSAAAVPLLVDTAESSGSADACMQTQLHVVPTPLRSRCCSYCVQPRFRSLWERYCRGVQAIVYVVDAADHEAVKVRRAACKGGSSAQAAGTQQQSTWEAVTGHALNAGA
jgi:hypothetical protein